MNISLPVMEMVGMGLGEVWKCPASDWYPGLKGAYSTMPGWESGSYVSRGWWVGGVTSGCWFSADGTRLTPAPPQHISKGQNGDIPVFRSPMGFWGLQCLPTSIPKAEQIVWEASEQGLGGISMALLHLAHTPGCLWRLENSGENLWCLSSVIEDI